ncbi:hypothetical protein [Roseivirga thermotolerans]|uniref:hypothetical protein n=1 Tax=Roseivirga thermotolerans TaxID=1758176 RepID=UPI00273FCCC8|nr:hypothetical protein [Roseivirga thermotolerans]
MTNKYIFGVLILLFVSFGIFYWIDRLVLTPRQRDFYNSSLFNEQRVNFGLPPITQSLEKTETFGIWVGKSTSYPQHSLKELQFSGKKPKTESDSFVFIDSTGKKLTLTSYFRYHEKCFNFYVYGNGPRVKIDCKGANEILLQNNIDFTFDACNDCIE